MPSRLGLLSSSERLYLAANRINPPFSIQLLIEGDGALWLASLRAATWRRHLLHLPILAPQAVLPLWYLWSHHAVAP